jgi:hypothetical protein
VKITRKTPGLVIEVTAEYEDTTTRSDGWTCHRWSIVLTYQGRTMKSPFFQGMAHTEAPTLQDVLESLFLDASVGEMTFEDYCSDFGSNSDSIAARNTWRACKSTARAVRRLLGEDYETIRQETEDKLRSGHRLPKPVQS